MVLKRAVALAVLRRAVVVVAGVASGMGYCFHCGKRAAEHVGREVKWKALSSSDVRGVREEEVVEGERQRSLS